MAKLPDRNFESNVDNTGNTPGQADASRYVDHSQSLEKQEFAYGHKFPSTDASDYIVEAEEERVNMLESDECDSAEIFGFSEYEDRPALHEIEEFLDEKLEAVEQLQSGELYQDSTPNHNLDPDRASYIGQMQQNSAGIASDELNQNLSYHKKQWNMPVVASIGFCSVVICLGVLAWSNYNLYSENQKMEASLQDLESKLASAKPLYLNTNKRVDRLIGQMTQMHKAVLQLNDQNYSLFVKGEPDYLPNDFIALSNLTVALQRKIDSLSEQHDITRQAENKRISQPTVKERTAMKQNQASDADSLAQKVNNKKAVKSGKWIVNLVSLRNKRNADKLHKQFQSQSIPVEKQTVNLNGKPIYRLRVSGFRSKKEADKFGTKTIKQLNLKSYWITT